MKTIAFIAMLLCSYLAAAQEQECGEQDGKHWTTNVKLESAQVTLHWTSVYEGVDTVCGVTYKASSGSQKTLGIYGQPAINKKQSLIGFVTCADDGCDKEIHIADISREVVLKTNLPISANQFYLKARWKGAGRELLIDAEPFMDGKAQPSSHFLCHVTESVRCRSVR